MALKKAALPRTSTLLSRYRREGGREGGKEIRKLVSLLHDVSSPMLPFPSLPPFLPPSLTPSLAWQVDALKLEFPVEKNQIDFWTHYEVGREGGREGKREGGREGRREEGREDEMVDEPRVCLCAM